ncbi:MAG: cytochrome c-550 PedF [Maritimibacter sp.]
MRFNLPMAALALISTTGFAVAHGDVSPQPVNTDILPDVGEEWLTENPYREDPEAFAAAIKIGDSGYNQNCARCHGLGVVSGGLAPDLRYLEAEEYGDEWYIERFRYGYTQNGTTKMPAFEEVLGQKAAWAIRSYIEARPEDGALDAFADRLSDIRDQLMAGEGDAAAIAAELEEINAGVLTASGAPVADSAAIRAAHLLEQDEPDFNGAGEALTIGLSAAE